MKKSLIAAAAITAAVAGLSATSAQAGKVHVDVGVGLGGGYWGPGPGYGGYYPEPYPVYVEPDYYPGGSYGVSCGEARWSVKSAHFRNVQALKCSGRTYVFTGWKHGDKYRIRVSRRDGDIISVSAIY